MHVLEQIEAQHRVETPARDREPFLHVAGDEAHGRQAGLPEGAEPHPERLQAGVDAGDLGPAPSRLERVHAVAAADVEQGRARRHVLEIPVVLQRVVQQVLGVYVVAALQSTVRRIASRWFALAKTTDRRASGPQDHRVGRIARIGRIVPNEGSHAAHIGGRYQLRVAPFPSRSTR